MNRIILIGRLTADPEIKYTRSQLPTCNCVIAVDRNINKAEREAGKKSADFICITLYGKQAELFQKLYSKGSQVAIEGRLQTGLHVRKDGGKSYTSGVIVERFDFIGVKPDYPGDNVLFNEDIVLNDDNIKKALISELKKQYPGHIVLIQDKSSRGTFYYAYEDDAFVLSNILNEKFVRTSVGPRASACDKQFKKITNLLLHRGFSYVVYANQHVTSVKTPKDLEASKKAKEDEWRLKVTGSSSYSGRKRNNADEWSDGVWTPGLPSSRKR